MALVVLWRTGWWLYQAGGEPWPHDYVAQWAAGHRVLSGDANLVYDWAEHATYQARLIGSSKPVELYVFYPPHFLFTTPLFTWLDHVQASLAFVLVTAAAYAASLNLLLKDWCKSILVAVGGGGAFYSIWWTQNGFLTAALLTAGVALLKHRPALGGIFFGLLTIKPQLGLLIPVALLFSKNWRAMWAAAATFVVLAIASEFVLGSGIWATFFTSLREASTFLHSGNLWFKQQSIFALMWPIFGPPVAGAMQALLAIVVAAIMAWMWSRSGPRWVRSSALISGSLLMTPYLYPYDAVPLTAAAVMLLHVGPQDRRWGRALPSWQRLLVFACCLAPLASRFIYSAAVPTAALVMLYVAVRQFASTASRSSDTTGDAAVLPIATG